MLVSSHTHTHKSTESEIVFVVLTSESLDFLHSYKDFYP